MKFKKTLPTWLVASTALILHSVANAEADTWCGWEFDNISRMKLEKVVACLEDGADPYARDEWRNTPLHYAADGGSAEAVKRLLEVGVDPNARSLSNVTPLHIAAHEDDEEAVKLLLEAGADPNAEDGDWGRTPLHWGAWEGSAEAVKLLLKWGADPSAKGEDGMTPLDEAEERNHAEVAKLLRGVGARE